MKVPVRYVVELRRGREYIACYRADTPHIKLLELAVDARENAVLIAEWYTTHKPEREI